MARKMIITCDLCKKEVAEQEVKAAKYRVLTHCEWTEGRATEPHTDILELELCPKCLMLSTNLQCSARGQDLKLINERM